MHNCTTQVAIVRWITHQSIVVVDRAQQHEGKTKKPATTGLTKSRARDHDRSRASIRCIYWYASRWPWLYVYKSACISTLIHSLILACLAMPKLRSRCVDRRDQHVQQHATCQTSKDRAVHVYSYMQLAVQSCTCLAHARAGARQRTCTEHITDLRCSAMRDAEDYRTGRTSTESSASPSPSPFC